MQSTNIRASVLSKGVFWGGQAGYCGTNHENEQRPSFGWFGEGRKGGDAQGLNKDAKELEVVKEVKVVNEDEEKVQWVEEYGFTFEATKSM